MMAEQLWRLCDNPEHDATTQWPICPVCHTLIRGLVPVPAGALLIEDRDAASKRAIVQMRNFLRAYGLSEGYAEPFALFVLRAAAGE